MSPGRIAVISLAAVAVIVERFKRYGPAYGSAVAMDEATLIDFNRTRGKAAKLVAIYPSAGTFFSDNPLVVPAAPWVTPQLRGAADAFVKFLTERVTPQVAARAGFHMSGSVFEEGKLEQAKEGLRAFFGQLSPRDRVGLLFFNDKVFPGLPVTTFKSGKAKLASTVRDLLPAGETAWLDATDAAVEKVQALEDPTRINAVVLLTDGEDTSSRTSPAALARTLDAQARSEGSTVRVYTIAYGSEANKSALETVAKASGGKACTGDPKQIESVYLSISSFF